MTFIRTAPDGATEYLCMTFYRYYRPEHVIHDSLWVWCDCALCDTQRQQLMPGAKPQPHCYPLEEHHASAE